MKSLYLHSLLILTIMASSCNNSKSFTKRVDTITYQQSNGSYIINGKEIPNSEDKFKAVFKLPSNSTATFVSKRVFFTAAHSVEDASPTSGLNKKIFGQNVKYFFHPKYGKVDDGEFDIAVGILEQDLFSPETEKPINVCNIPKSENLENRNTLFIGYGCNIVVWDDSKSFPIGYRGGAIKRYGYSPISKISNDIVITSDPNGALSCPGDSGAPYLLIDNQNQVCFLATNFVSDRKATNKGTNVLFPEVKDWLIKVISDENIEICGLNKVCENSIIPQNMLPEK